MAVDLVVGLDWVDWEVAETGEGLLIFSGATNCPLGSNFGGEGRQFSIGCFNFWGPSINN